MSKYARRKDANQQEVEDALSAIGCQVIDTHNIGGGYPDLHVVTPCGDVCMVEVKMPGEGLTRSETVFLANYRGWIIIARSGQEAVDKVRRGRVVELKY
jgi:hypothetical protein